MGVRSLQILVTSISPASPYQGRERLSGKVNGRMVPLNTTTDGDQVNRTMPTPLVRDRDWLNIVKTSKARNKIRQTRRTRQRNSRSAVDEKLLMSMI